MLAIDRMKAIMEILKENKSVMVSDLSNRFEVTEETIRRDLEKLEFQRKIIRVHGGAYIFDGFERGAPATLRKQFFVEEKKLLAKTCLEYIKDKDTIMLDSSTTSLAIANEVKASTLQLVVITNFLDIMMELADCTHVKLIGLGGSFSNNTRSFNGPRTVNSLNNYFADKSFVSCSSINPNFGVTDHSENEAQIRKLMLHNAKTNLLVIDHTKLDKSSTYKFADFNDLDYIIADKIPDGEWKDKIIKSGVKLRLASE